MKLSELQNNKRTIPVEFEGGVVDVTYAPAKFTTRRLREAQERRAAGAGVSIAEQLSELIVNWGFTDEKGKPIKPTLEILDDLPVTVLTKIQVALMADIFRPNSPTPDET